MDGLLLFLWLVGLVQLPGFVSTKQKVNIGVISHNPQEEVDSPNCDPLRDGANGELEIDCKPIRVSEKDSLSALNELCQSTCQENGLTAIIHDETKVVSGTLQSAGAFLGVPYFQTGWVSRDSKQHDTTISLYPEAALLSQAYASIIQSLDWIGFAVVYENEESLVRLQDVIKLQRHMEKGTRNSLVLKKLKSSGDNRDIFKAIRRQPIYCIVIDCGTDKIIEVLSQAKQVMVLDDISTNIFLTSLDAHTLDYSSLNTRANITTARLYDPSSDVFRKMSEKYYPDIKPEKIAVKTALVHDAMLVLAESLNAIKSTHADGDIVYEPLFCNASEKYDDKYGLVSAIQETVVEGMTGQISLKSRKRDAFQLNVIELGKMDKPIGLWSSEEPDKVHLTRNATEREAELQRRLQSHNFIVTSRIGGPYLFLSDNKEASGNDRYYGYSMDLITEIAKMLNISFEFRITQNNLYPNLQKDLIARRADLAICDFTITPQRREVIDFSMPFMTLGIGILHKKELTEEEANMYGFLGPLSTIVWLYIGILYLIMSFILVIIARMSSTDWENPHPCDPEPSELENIWDLKNCCWLTLGSITTQGCDILPKGVCTRIATASWWFFSLIITASYTANLAAFLTMSKKDDSVDSVEELATQNKIKYGCLLGGATASFFQHSNNSLYQRMWNTMANEKPSVFEDSNANGVERVLSTKNSLYAFFMESTGIEYEMERHCELRRIGDMLDSKSYGIGMPMNAEYRHSINAAILRMQETGALSALKEKWWKVSEEEACAAEVPVNTDALALENVGGVFIVLAAGIGLAYLIAIVEFLWNVYSISVEEHISFVDALKVEVKFACNIFISHKRAKPLLSESSSDKSDGSGNNKSLNPILKGAGSVLNINTSILNTVGSSLSTINNNNNNSSGGGSRKTGSKRS